MVGLDAVCGVRGAYRAWPLARLRYRRACFPRPARRNARRLCSGYTDGCALAGVYDGGGSDRFAPSPEPHRLDFLWCRTTLRNTALHHGVRQLRANGEFRVAWRGVRGLALDVGG